MEPIYCLHCGCIHGKKVMKVVFNTGFKMYNGKKYNAGWCEE